jgi:hypothetical protein
MKFKGKVASWVVMVAVLAGALVGVYWVHRWRSLRFLSGVVIRQDADSRKQIPIAGVEISASDDLAAGECKSDASGFFRLALRGGGTRGGTVSLLFRHPDYEPLEVNDVAVNKICVARMAPISRENSDTASHPDVVIANVDVRYSIRSTAEVNVGSVVKTFQAVNTGNVPCNNRRPCSPDGNWKAAIGSISLDAGPGNQFRNLRVSCIAGPCPFTNIESPNYSRDGRTLKVSALDWSDTATFLLEVEVDTATISDIGRESYPVTFGEALNFTLPAGADGVFIEAELNGTPTVFPLGPDLLLSWAECSASANPDRAKAYRRALTPGYKFQ